MPDENPNASKTPRHQRSTILGLMGFVAMQGIIWGPYLNSIRENDRTIGEGVALRSTVEQCRKLYPEDVAPGSLIRSERDEPSGGWFFAIGRDFANAPLLRVWVDRFGAPHIHRSDDRLPRSRRPAYTIIGVDPPKWEAISAHQSPKRGGSP